VIVWSVKKQDSTQSHENHNKGFPLCKSRCGLGITPPLNSKRNSLKSDTRCGLGITLKQRTSQSKIKSDIRTKNNAQTKKLSMNDTHKSSVWKVQCSLAIILLLCSILWIYIRETTIHKLNQQITTSWSQTLDQSSELSSHGHQIAPVIVMMSNFTEKVKSKEKWISKPFFAFERGYKMYLSVDAAGDGQGKGTHISVFLYLMKGPYDDELEQSGHWPLRGTITIELLNQLNDKNHYSRNVVTSSSPTDSCRNAYQRVTDGLRAFTGCGYHTFIEHQTLATSDINYIKGEAVYFGVRYKNYRYIGQSGQSYSKEVSRMTKELSKQYVSSQQRLWSQTIMLYSKISSYGNQVVPVIVKVSNFSEKMKNKKIWQSDPFFAFEGGHKMCLIVYADGIGDGVRHYISVFLYLMKGPYDGELEQSGHWPLRGAFTIELLNQLNDENHYSRNETFHNAYANEGYRHPYGQGSTRFISHDDMLQGEYLKSDNVYFRVNYNS